MSRQSRALGAGIVFMLALVVGACGSTPSGPKVPIMPTGNVTDSGFRPGQNGFAFENYGAYLSDGSTAPTNLTAADVEKMFGDGVCADAQLRKCDLIPEAQAWLDETNQAMVGGHCYGFSVLAGLLWQGKLASAAYGASDSPGLQIFDNPSLQRQIAYDWALQTLESAESQRISGTPNKILLTLMAALKPNAPEAYTIVFWKRDGTGGHAVTPFAVTSRGGGLFDVLIYDNNWPGETRAITFDTNRNTWSYNASTNPNEADSLYIGDAKSKTISLDPASPGLGTQECPFCQKVPNKGSSPKGGTNTTEISLLGNVVNHASLVISDEAGHKLGYINGRLVSQIPGATVAPVISEPDWNNKEQPDFFVRADKKYTITLDGSGLSVMQPEAINVIGPSYDVAVKNIRLQPGEKDTLVVEPDATHLSYQSSRPETPTIDVGVSDYQAYYSFELAGVSDRPGSTVNIFLPAEGQSLKLQTVGPGTASLVNFKLTRETESGVQVFQHDAIPLAPGNAAQIRFAGWTEPGQTMPLTVTHGGQSSVESLINQAGA